MSRIRPWSRIKKRLPSGRFARILLFFFALLLVGRVSMVWVLPWALDRVAAGYGLRCDVATLDLDLLAGDVELWHLEITPREEEESLISLEYACAEIGILSLLRGDLVVRRLEIDGLDLLLERDSAGTWNLLEILENRGDDRDASEEEENEESPDSPPENTGSEPGSEEEAPVELDSPVRIDAFRAQHVRVVVRDASVTPPFNAQVNAHLRLSDVGSSLRKSRFELTVTSPSLLDGLTVDATGSSDSNRLDSRLDVRLRGLRLAPFEAYLNALDLKPAARTLDFSLAGEFHAKPREEPSPSNQVDTMVPGALQAVGRIQGIELTGDGKSLASLDECVIEIDRWTQQVLEISRVSVSDGILLAERSADGNLRCGGIEVNSGPSSSTDSPEKSPENPLEDSGDDPKSNESPGPLLESDSTVVAATRSATTESQPPSPKTPPSKGAELRTKIERVLFEELGIVFEDHFLEEPARHEIRLTELSLSELDFFAGREDQPPTDLRVTLEAPHLFEEIVVEGNLTPFSPEKTVALELHGSGVRLQGLEPYLSPSGIRPQLDSGSLRGRLDASFGPAGSSDSDPTDRGFQGRLELTELQWSDGDELFSLERISIPLTELDPRTSRVRLGEVSVQGSRLAAVREEEGVIKALGFDFTPPSSDAPSSDPEKDRNQASSSTRAPEGALVRNEKTTSPRLPQIQIERVLWQDLRIEFVDRGTSPPSSWALTDFGIDLRNLSLGMDSQPPAELEAWLKAPGVAEEVRVEGTVSTSLSGGALDLEVRAEGLSSTRLAAPYLNRAGIAGNLSGGRLQLNVAANVGLESGALSGSFDLTALALNTSEEEELLSCERVAIQGVSIHPERVSIDEVEIRTPRFVARRDAAGSVHVLGVSFPKARPQDTSPASIDSPSPSTPTKTSSLEAGPAPEALLKHLSVTGASVTWIDDSLPETTTVSAVVDAELAEIQIGRDPSPGTFRAHLSIPENDSELEAKGTVVLGTERQRAKLEVSARGLRGGVLSPYLPPEIGLEYEDGNFQATLTASASRHPSGGQTAEFSVENLKLADRKGESQVESLLSLPEAKISLERADFDEGLLTIREISLSGLELGVKKRADGRLDTLGLVLGGPAPSSEAQGDSGSQSPSPVPNPSPPRAPSSSELPRLEDLPLVTLKTLDLQIAKIRYTDEAAGSEAIELSDLRLWNPDPIEQLGGEESWDRDSAIFHLEGSLAPLVSKIGVVLEADVFAPEPELSLKWDLEGIDGRGFPALLPGLESQVDTSNLTDGRLLGEANVRLKKRRRHPLDFDLSRGFGVEAELRDVELRRSEGPSLLSLEEAVVDVSRFRPDTGDLRIRTVELIGPRGSMTRKADGIHVAGLVVRVPLEPELVAETSPSEEKLPPTAAGNGSENPTEPESGEISIGELLVRGMTFEIRDETGDPPVELPLTDLEVDVRNLSSHFDRKAAPVRFSVILQAGKVELHEDIPRTANAFGEIAAAGQVSLFPKPKGYLKANVNALALANFKGAAETFGVELDEGVFDGLVDVRLPGDGSIQPRAKFFFTDLDLSEDPNGPLRRILKLPAPLDVVLFVLKDETGTIEIPLDLEVGEDGISGGAIAQVAVSTLGTLIGNAMKSSVFRVAGSVSSLGGLIGSGEEETESDGKREPDLVVGFNPGDSFLPSSARREVRRLLERLEEDEHLVITLRHHLGKVDLEKATVRANPSPDDCRDLVARLRLRKRRLEQARAEAAAETRAALSCGRLDQAAELRRQLSALDHRRGALEDSLDRILSLLRPGSEHLATRRAQASCVALAEARLNEVERLVQELLKTAEEGRVRIRTPRFKAPEHEAGGVVSLTLTQNNP